jgi:FKBP-type peptidyl-prolyl cis-trans isomerase SlpA
MTRFVEANSFLTLHYCLASPEGEEFLSTEGLSPATLQMGGGQLADCLESRLLGLAEGAEFSFDLAPEEAFGVGNPQLVERIKLSALPPGANAQENSVVEFTTPDGLAVAAFLRKIDGDAGIFDFNHPLSGKALRFSGKIIGVL